jgi:hypothetical protein
VFAGANKSYIGLAELTLISIKTPITIAKKSRVMPKQVPQKKE